ncbi:histidine phosphatase family protein [Thiocapsa sp.]|uniref:histidine phosphatase family protein n=1 Tax=Thiocapsa sp. TaxID=2024551 RepID=UPI00343AE3EA
MGIRNDVPGWDIWRDGCPGGDSPDDVSARADRLIARLSKMQGTIALFSHGQFGAAFAVCWIGLALMEGQHFPLHTASVSLLGVDAHHPDRRTIELWNDRAVERKMRWACAGREDQDRPRCCPGRQASGLTATP